MANGRDDLSLLPEFRDNFGVDWAGCEVEHRTESSDVEDGIVVVDLDVGKLLGVLEELLHFVVIPEVYIVLWICLTERLERRKKLFLRSAYGDTGQINWRVGTGQRGELNLDVCGLQGIVDVSSLWKIVSLL